MYQHNDDHNHNLGSSNHNLGPPNHELENPFVQNEVQPTNLYLKAVSHYNVANTILLLYSLSKMLASLTLLGLIFQTPIHKNLEMWCRGLAIHSFLMINYYLMLLVWMMKQSNRTLVAIRLQQTQYQNQEHNYQQGQEESRQITLLATQIKYEVQKANCFGSLNGKVCFVTFQILFFWGLKIFFQLYGTTTGHEKLLFNLLTVVLFLSVYQFIDFYIILVIAILLSPFSLIFCISYVFQLCGKRRQVQLTMESLDVKIYQPNMLEGDQQCSICYSAYQLDESVICLRCSPKHHFHSECIKAWLQIQTNCPLCRTQVIESEPQQ